MLKRELTVIGEIYQNMLVYFYLFTIAISNKISHQEAFHKNKVHENEVSLRSLAVSSPSIFDKNYNATPMISI